MTQKDYNKLKGYLDRAVEKHGPWALRQHRKLKLGKDHDKRFAWDIFYFSGVKLGDGVGMPGDIDLYAYLDDDHITTALLKYVREREDLNIDQPEPLIPRPSDLPDPLGIIKDEDFCSCEIPWTGMDPNCKVCNPRK